MNIKAYLSSIVVLCVSHVCIGQDSYKIIGDKHFVYSYDKFLDSLQVDQPNFKEVDIELRIWHFDWKSGNNSFIQVRKLEDGRWICMEKPFYYYNGENYKFTGISKNYELGPKWLASWKTILDSNYLNISTQKNPQGLKTPSGEIPIFADGEDYTIEVVTRKNKRKISYNNPWAYRSFYKENGMKAKEYEDFILLINLLRNSFAF